MPEMNQQEIKRLKAEEKQVRLAAKLRENLRRRKVQTKERKVSEVDNTEG